jgi:hypothetical protein
VHKPINGALILLILELGIEFDAGLVLEDFCLAVQDVTNADWLGLRNGTERLNAGLNPW